MLISMYTIQDTITRMNTLNGTIKTDSRKDELATYQNKFYAMAYDLQLGLGEAAIMLSNDILFVKYENIMIRIAEAQNAANNIELKKAIEEIIGEFKDFDYESYEAYNFSGDSYNFYSSNRANDEYKIENTRALTSMVRNTIKVPVPRDITMFYPDCKSASCLSPFSLTMDRLLSYGNEANEHYLSSAKKVFTKVVKGEMKGSRIQNNAFDVLYIQPRIVYEFDKFDLFAKRREEKQYINDMFKYLRNDGVMVITMPVTRLYKDVCTMLSKQFKNIQVFKVNNNDFNKIGLVHIVGQKDPQKEPRQEEYAKLRMLYDHKRVKSFEDLDKFEYALPRANTVIELFKGSSLDLEEVENIIDKSSLMNKMWDSQKAEKLEENIKNPLLPFNIGQLGLVLTSGCLDGIVDEGDGNKHLIKGRVSKFTQEVETESEKGLEVTETIVNKVEINVLMPNGDFKVLA